MRLQGSIQEERPIFIQVAELLEDAILRGAYGEEEQVPSITELSVACKINPATALKGVNLLVEAGLLYKKRGTGMFVARGARERLLQRRRQQFYRDYMLPAIREAKRLGISPEELSAMTEKGYGEDGN
jgi:DNA-binding transcriptional regulator YhcF (GntR family)